MPERKIVVLYHSQGSGNTRVAAELVVQGIRAAGGFELVIRNTNDARLDPAILEDCAGVAVGTPDYFEYPAGSLKMFMDDWLIARRGGNRKMEGMPVALFLVHSASVGRDRRRHDEVLRHARKRHEELFRHIGPQVGRTLASIGTPEGHTARDFVALGRDLTVAADKYLREHT